MSLSHYENTPPTREGWYWHKQVYAYGTPLVASGSFERIFRVFWDPDSTPPGLFVELGDMERRLERFHNENTWWCGPLTSPKHYIQDAPTGEPAYKDPKQRNTQKP